MCFFKSLKSEDVFKVFEQVAPNLKMKGYPYGNVQGENFKISPYNSCKKESCVFGIKVQYGKWKMEFDYHYDNKAKEVRARVWFYNLCLDGKNREVSRQLQQSIKNQFKQFDFSFMPTATMVVSHTVKVKKAEQVTKFLSDFEYQWNNSGVLSYLTQFKTNEELGMK